MKNIVVLIILILCANTVRASELAKIEESLKNNIHNLADYELITKEFYKEQNWPRFFALAQFYRLRIFPKVADSISSIIELEALSLAKHCQFEQAKKVIAQTQTLRPKEDLKSLLDLKDKIDLLEAFEIKLQNESKGVVKKEHKNQTLWPVNNKVFEKIKHPFNLRIGVKNLCVN